MDIFGSRGSKPRLGTRSAIKSISSHICSVQVQGVQARALVNIHGARCVHESGSFQGVQIECRGVTLHNGSRRWRRHNTLPVAQPLISLLCRLQGTFICKTEAGRSLAGTFDDEGNWVDYDDSTDLSLAVYNLVGKWVGIKKPAWVVDK